MSVPRHFLNRRPRPKGWKRSVQHTSKRDLTELRYTPPPNDGKGYLLAPCVVLAAAVILEPWAYHAAHYWLPAARAVDAKRYST